MFLVFTFILASPHLPPKFALAPLKPSLIVALLPILLPNAPHLFAVTPSFLLFLQS